MVGAIPHPQHDGGNIMNTVTNEQIPELREYDVEILGFWNWGTTVMATSPENAKEEADKEFSWDDVEIDRKSGLVQVDGEELE